MYDLLRATCANFQLRNKYVLNASNFHHVTSLRDVKRMRHACDPIYIAFPTKACVRVSDETLLQRHTLIGCTSPALAHALALLMRMLGHVGD